MTDTEIEDIVWSLVKPASKCKEPKDSDGYDEAEVYFTALEVFKKAKELWYDKAYAWDELDKEIAEIYSDEGNEDKDMIDIGEICARHLGYIE